MSRIGNRDIIIPEGVTVTINNNEVIVKGPKGELSTTVHPKIKVLVDGNVIKTVNDNDNYKKFHGTANANINNLIVGVTDGYEKKLEAFGVGYRFALKGNLVVISAGFSHPVEEEVPEGLTAEVPANNQLVIKGIDKQAVGQFAAIVRKKRPPEPYKGKGIRYAGEMIIRKAGKTAKK